MGYAEPASRAYPDLTLIPTGICPKRVRGGRGWGHISDGIYRPPGFPLFSGTPEQRGVPHTSGRLEIVEAECFHIPNGGYRRKVEAAILKGMGVAAGTPDICILWRPGKVAFIELKALGKSNISPAQRVFHLRLWELGVPNAVCRSIDDVRAQLKTWGVQLRDVTMVSHQ
jgi:hypothetical protein